MKLRADSGDRDAQLRVGRYYDRGIGTAQNHDEAARYYELAAKQGDPHAMFNLACYLQAGGALDTDLSAADWFQRAADEFNMPRASLHLAIILISTGDPEDLPAAENRLRVLADSPNNDPDAQYYLGRLLDDRGESAAAKRYFELAHAQGIDAASCDLATMSLEGRPDVPQNAEFAMETYGQAAGREHPMAHYNLGTIYQAGLYGQPKDLVKAKRHYKFAAEHGNVLGMVKYATMLVIEARKMTDEKAAGMLLGEAAEHFRIAAESGNPLAQNNYGRMLMNGEGVLKDVPAAKRMFLRAGEQELTPALVNLAEIFEKGLDGNEPSRTTAERLLTKAKDAGNKEARDRLAAMGL
jgi:TPR repeat protein